MTRINNPFITSGYISADYFCDREAESKQLIREIVNGNNLAIISTRRMGKNSQRNIIHSSLTSMRPSRYVILSSR